MQKIQISFDAKKLDKNLMNNGYVSLDIIKLKEDKVKVNKDKQPIKGDGWVLMQSHFVKQSNKNKDAEMPIIGDGVYFKETSKEEAVEYPVDDINPNDIPF